MVRDVLLDDLVQSLIDFRIDYTLHKSDMRIDTQYGRIFMRSAENWERWRGVNLAWGGIDEIAQLRTNKAWEMLLSRLRSNGTRIAFGSTTPEGFNFVYDYWANNPGPGYELIRAKTTDNRHLPADYIESLYQNYSARLVDQYVNGEFVVLEGRVYEEYGPENHDGWTYAQGLETFVAMDFGYNRPSILFAQVDKDGAVHWFHEIRCRNMTTDTQARKMREYAQSLGLGNMTAYCDPAGIGHQSGSHYTDVQILAQHGFSAQYTTAKSLRSIAAGVEITQGLFCNGAGERRMFVNPDACPDLHRSLQAFRYKENNRSEPDKDGVNDHDCDAIRYFAINRFPPRIAADWRIH